jgi:ribosomal protein S18 acetylase RimI-like enzyme
VDVVSLGYRTDLMLRRLAGAQTQDRGGYLVVRTPANPGFWWGNFLLFGAPPGPGDGARWLAAFAAEFPTAGHLALGVDGTGGDCGDASELAAMGVTVEVNTVLTAARVRPPGRPLGGVQCRPLAGGGDWAQALALRVACDGDPEEPGDPTDPDYRQFLERQVSESRLLCERGHGSWFGAFVDGQLRSGCGIFTDGRGLARFQAVETHPGFRRRGLASHVVAAAARHALSLGAATLVIVADPAAPAIGIYRSLGFADTQRQVQLQR